MKKLAALLFFLVVSPETIAQQNYFPGVETVALHFYSTYNITQYENKALHKFEKRVDGWHVAFFGYEDIQKVKADYLIWSASQSKYQALFLPLATPEDSANQAGLIASDFQGVDTFYYNHFPYYGYRGWFNDVISLLSSQKQLNDTLMYALGRAYSEYASCLLYDNLQTALPGMMIRTKDGPDALTTQQLEVYLKNRNAAIECFKKTNALNPAFETLIGSIYMKYCTEQMVKFYDLLVFQNENIAMRELPDNLFSAFTISMAKNFLMTCDSNAVVFTNGDMDSYPLWYVQARFNYRRDIFVANLSLMNTAYYLNFLRVKCFDAQPLSFSFLQSEYNKDQLRYAYIEENSDSFIDISNLKINLHEIEAQSNLKNYIFSNNAFSMSADQYQKALSAEKHYYSDARFDDTIKWIFSGRYILQSHIFLLDFIGQNKWQRPVYFTSTCGEGNMAGLDHYLFADGLNYQVAPYYHEDLNTPALKNSDKLYNQLMHQFTYDVSDELSIGEKLFVSCYINLFTNLSPQLLYENKKDKAVEVMDKCLLIFNNDMVPYDAGLYKIMSNYAEAGMKDKARALYKQILYNLENKNTVNAESKLRGSANYKYEIESLHAFAKDQKWE